MSCWPPPKAVKIVPQQMWQAPAFPLRDAIIHPHLEIWGGIFLLGFSSILPFVPFLPSASNQLDKQTNQASHFWVRSVKPSCLLLQWKLKLQREAVVWCRTSLQGPREMWPLRNGQQQQ